MYSNTHHTKTLADLLDGGRRMTAEEIFSIIFPTLHILKDMHRRGKVHGHISPDCIVLEDNDRLLFCCPLNTAAQTRLLKSIQVSGTSFCRMISLTDSSVDFAAEAAPYRALETYMNGPLTPAADVYSLCAVIYRAITGTPPKTAQEKMYGGQPALPASDAAGADIELTDILNKGMALLPGGRYADAGELAASLEIYRVRLLCEDFAKKYPNHYSAGITSALKKGLGITTETVYLSHDDTFRKSGKNGFAVTDQGFFCRNIFSAAQAMTFEQFKAADNISDFRSGIIYADGQPIVCISGISSREQEQADLKDLIKAIQKTL
mgnify:CR=1 FL=1